MLAALRDIFVSEKNTRTQRHIVARDLTEKYQKQWKDFSLQKVYIACPYWVEEKYHLHAFKYRKNRQHLREYVAMFEKMFSQQRLVPDFIIYPPIHWTTRMIRGKNHMKVVADKVSKQIGVPTIHAFSRNSPSHQARLSRGERRRGLTSTFQIRNKYRKLIISKNIVLIDDVVSTGSTCHFLWKILCEGGAKSVQGLFLYSSGIEKKKTK